jgi:hypothetical protein
VVFGDLVHTHFVGRSTVFWMKQAKLFWTESVDDTGSDRATCYLSSRVISERFIEAGHRKTNLESSMAKQFKKLLVPS